MFIKGQSHCLGEAIDIKDLKLEFRRLESQLNSVLKSVKQFQQKQEQLLDQTMAIKTDKKEQNGYKRNLLTQLSKTQNQLDWVERELAQNQAKLNKLISSIETEDVTNLQLTDISEQKENELNDIREMVEKEQERIINR